MGLIQFMNARLDEDGHLAQAALDEWGDESTRYEWEDLPDASFTHARHHSPARALREVAAKRARLALMSEAIDEMDKLIADDDAGRPDQAMAIGRARAATVAVKHDATVYSDHPDYEQKWAP